jgi:hypothetical protein
MERYAARKADGATKRLEHLGAMTPLELFDEVLRLDEDIRLMLRQVHRHKVQRTYLGGVVNCDRRLWSELNDRFLTLDYKVDPT